MSQTNHPVPTEHTAPVATPGRVGQATAVEQSRAVAEVQAAVIVAQQCPRDIDKARTRLQVSCGMLPLAERAFYRFPRGGQTVAGESIHLARELAACWGNIDYGISEMRRDDAAEESEMKAWAWDQETNSRSSNTFIVKHQRDTRQGTQRLTDQRDIYENNTNMGARRLREAIFSVLPVWFKEEGKDICLKTLQVGDGKPLTERVEGAIRAFDALGITLVRLEQKLGRSSDRWTAFDIAQLLITHRSIQRGEVTIDDEFPQARVTVDEITAQATESKPNGDTEQQTLVDAAGTEYADDDPERPM